MKRLPKRSSSGMSLGEVAKDLGVPLATLRRHVGGDIVPDDRGRFSGKAVAAFVVKHPDLIPERGEGDVL